MSIIIKAYLKIGSNASGEIRRFEMEPKECRNFECLTKRLMNTFPSLANENISVAWKDSEGDLIVFSSDAELESAFKQLQEDVFRIYIQKNAQPGDIPEEGEGSFINQSYSCRGCGIRITGPCFKCLVCLDYFLCKHCEKIGTHLEHDLIRIRKRKFSRSGVNMEQQIIPSSPNSSDAAVQYPQYCSGTSFARRDSSIVIPGAMQGRGVFLSPKEVLHLMTAQQPSGHVVPNGRKENVYFLLNNSENVYRRANHMNAVYVDDCGVWAYSSLKTHYYIISGMEHKLEYIDRKDGLYCRATKRERIPLNPQPKEETIISFRRYYLSLKRCKTFRKRVSTVDMCPEHLNSLKFLAVIEYTGPYPSQPEAHGNSKKNFKEYKRKSQAKCKIENDATENDAEENDAAENDMTENDATENDDRRVNNGQECYEIIIETEVPSTENVPTETVSTENVTAEDALVKAIHSIQSDM